MKQSTHARPGIIGNRLDHLETEYRSPMNTCAVTGIMMTDNYCMGTESIASCKFWAKWVGDSRYGCHFEQLKSEAGFLRYIKG